MVATQPTTNRLSTTSAKDQAAQQAAVFDWPTYADATLAGLSVLIPIPLLDMAFEGYFRRRMPQTIVRQDGQTLTPTVLQLLQARPETFSNFWRGCLLWPFKLLGEFIVRLSRKILYFLTIKKAVDALNYYWQRAFLLRYMSQQGYLTQGNTTLAVTALENTLAIRGKSPLPGLAQEIIYSPVRLWRTLWRARANQGDPLLDETSTRLSLGWHSFTGFFVSLAQHYEQEYNQLQQPPQS